MKLLLTSNGITSPELKEAFLEMTNGRTDLKVAIILTAGDPIEWIQDKEDGKKYVAKLLKQNKLEDSKTYLKYKQKGCSIIDGDLKQDPDVLKEKLQNVDIIDVGGGDANWLLDWAKKSRLDTYMKDLLDKGVVYIGESAGSMLPLPDIGLTWWEPDQGADHIGLGLVDFVITPHQKEGDIFKSAESLAERKKYLQSLIDFPWRVYLLQDGQAIKVDGDKTEHIGPGGKRFV